jgi:uncharacterized membrane protein
VKRPSWWTIAALITLLISILFLLVGLTNDPQDSVIVYRAYMFFSANALNIGIAVTIFGIVAISIWFLQGLLERQPRFRMTGAAALLFLLAGFIFLAASVPTLNVSYRHRASLSTPSHVYNLSFRTTLENQNQFVLFECDSLGIRCQTRYTSRYFPFGFGEDPLSLPTELVVTDDQTGFDIVVGQERIFRYGLRNEE